MLICSAKLELEPYQTVRGLTLFDVGLERISNHSLNFIAYEASPNCMIGYLVHIHVHVHVYSIKVTNYMMRSIVIINLLISSQL